MNAVRDSLRSLAHSPGYAAAFIVTLGLGIGLNSAIFSMVHGVLLAPLPYADADRLVYVEQAARSVGTIEGFSFAEVRDLAEAARTVDAFVEYGDYTFNVVGEGDPHRAVGGLVTANYFDVLGLRPQLGRLMQAQDDGLAAEPVVVLTHDYWARAFGADTAVLDRVLRLYAFGEPRRARVIGVLAPGTLYTGTRRQDFFVNYAGNAHYGGAAMQDERTHRMTDVFARLAPGVSIEVARAELESIHGTMRRANPEAYPANRGYELAVTPWKDALTDEARPFLLLLTGAVGLVLLLACANVANLTLTRMVRRERELAVRAALGAGVARIRASLVVEHLLLALAGAALGLLLARLGMDLLVQYASRYTVRTSGIGLDATVLAFTAAVSVLVAVLLAWLPSLPGGDRVHAQFAAAADGRGTAGPSRRRLQRILVVSQLALSFTLLAGAGLLVRSLNALSRVDAGFDYENVVKVDVPNVTGQPGAANRALMDEIVLRLEAEPGTDAVAYANRAPFTDAFLSRRLYRVEGRDGVELQSPLGTQVMASAAYFDALGLPVLRGRVFDESDAENTERVIVLNESLATHLFGGEDAVGRRIAEQQYDGTWGPWHRIVGVVGDTREYGLSLQSLHTVYRPSTQTFAGQTLIVRTTDGAGAVVRRVANLVGEMDPDRPVDNAATLAELRFENLSPPRLNATLFVSFALLALVIAAVGTFAVLAFTVSQRTREFGLRMALGAQENAVLRMVLAEGGALAVAAVLAGAVGSLVLTRFLRGLLFEIGPGDAATQLGAALLLLSVALLAAWLPARRATRAQPADVLRTD